MNHRGILIACALIGLNLVSCRKDPLPSKDFVSAPSEFPADVCRTEGITMVEADGDTRTFATVQGAINAAQPVNAIIVTKKALNENLVIRKKTSLRVVSPCRTKIKSITLDDSKAVRIEGFNVAPSSATASLQNLFWTQAFAADDRSLVVLESASSDVYIVNNWIHGAKNNASGLEIKSNNNRVNIQGNEISVNDGQGILISGNGQGDEYVVTKNKIYSNGRNGLLVPGLAKMTISQNLIARNGTKEAGGLNSYGLKIQNPNNQTAARVLITSNTVVQNRGKITANQTSADLSFKLDSSDTANITTLGTDGGGATAFSDTSPPVLTANITTPVYTSSTQTLMLQVDVSDGSSTRTQVRQNGQLIADFTNYSAALSITLASGVNNIAISSTDSGNRSNTLNLPALVLDQAAPTLNGLSSLPALTNQSTFSVPITITDLSPVNTLIKVNGNDFFQTSSKSFNLSFPLSIEGNNVVQLIVTDEAGNTTTQSQTIKRDTTPPTLSSTSPQTGSTLHELSFTVNGSASENLAEAKLNGQALSVSGSSFSGTYLSTVQGNLTLPLELKDAAGNVQTISLQYNIVVDQTAPDLQITWPAALTRLSSLSIPVTTQDENPGWTKVSINGVVLFETQNPSFNIPLTMSADGSYLVKVEAKDALGNEAPAQELTITRDATTPVLTILSPAAGSSLTDKTVVISGTSNEELSSVTVNGQSLTLSANGQGFSGGIFFQFNGSISLVFVAKDPAGNQRQVTVNATMNSTDSNLWSYAECSSSEVGQ